MLISLATVVPQATKVELLWVLTSNPLLHIGIHIVTKPLVL
jgi:hypothetical protein